MIEQLKELPTPPPTACDIKYLTVYCWLDRDGVPTWLSDFHKTLDDAKEKAEQRYVVPGTLRIFEVPKEVGNGN